MAAEKIRAAGHKNVTALHTSTFEITRDQEISTTADCIIAVAADKGAATLDGEFKAAAAHDDALITAIITSAGCSDTITGWGSSRLTFTEENSMVFRVSDFTCGRTIMISADKPAARLDRELVKALAEGSDVVVELRVEKGTKPRPSLDMLFEGEG